jgi:hypothetical protein
VRKAYTNDSTRISWRSSTTKAAWGSGGLLHGQVGASRGSACTSRPIRVPGPWELESAEAALIGAVAAAEL